MLQVELFNDNLQGEYVITLKEITDLIGARHNDSMRKVEDLSLEDGFGSLRKIRSQYESGKGRIDEIETYIFTKKQAIAVGARLNTTMLMKVINRLEELEIKKQPILTQQEFTMKAIAEMANGFLNVESQIKEVKNEILELKNTSTLDYAQHRIIQNAISAKVYEWLDSYNIPLDNKSSLFANIHAKLKNTFCVGSYKDIPKVRLKDALDLINTAEIRVGVK